MQKGKASQLLTKQKLLGQTELKAAADDNLHSGYMFVFDGVEILVEKGQNPGYHYVS